MFDDLFINEKIKPINKGNDLVLFHPIEAFKNKVITKNATNSKNAKTEPRTLTAGISAKYFIQGIFFAHEAEKKGLAIGKTGFQHEPQTRNSIIESKKWER